MALPSFLRKLFLFPILIIVLLILSALVEPTKTLTDVPREAMNCPNTDVFNQTAWDSQTAFQFTIYGTTCYALNLYMLLFIGLLGILALWGWFK